MIRRVTSYDGALLEQAHPAVHDVIEPDVARTMTAMLEDAVVEVWNRHARGMRPGDVPPAVKQARQIIFTDAWFIGFTPELTAGVWVGYDDEAGFPGKARKPGPSPRHADLARSRFMQGALTDGKPIEDFQNVIPLGASRDD